MKTTHLLCLAPLLGALSGPILADDANSGWDRFERRHDRQHARIEQGIRSGELSRKESKTLRHQQRHIAKLERQFRRDGHLNRYERHTLKREFDEASRHIFRLKHNDRRRQPARHFRHDHDDHHERERHTQPYRFGDRDMTSSHGRRYEDQGWSILLALWDRK